MTIKTYWALPVEQSAEHKPAVDAQHEAQQRVKELVQQRTGCDGVFFGTHGMVYAGFKQQPDEAIWKKKPLQVHGEYALMQPKAKTDAAAALNEARDIALSIRTFNDHCKAQWPSMAREVMGNGQTHTSFMITRTTFGFMKDQIVALVPFTDDEPIDKGIIGAGFVELTASEYAELNR